MSKKNLTVGSASAFFANAPVGWTRDAIVIGLDEETLVIEDIQQVATVVDVKRLRMSFTVKMNLVENTMKNLKLALGASGNIIQGTTTRKLYGDFGGDLPEGELIIYHRGPNNVLRTIKFYKAKRTECGEINLDARGYTVFPVTFQVVKHPDYNNLFIVEEEYIPSSVVPLE